MLMKNKALWMLYINDNINYADGNTDVYDCYVWKPASTMPMKTQNYPKNCERLISTVVRAVVACNLQTSCRDCFNYCQSKGSHCKISMSPLKFYFILQRMHGKSDTETKPNLLRQMRMIPFLCMDDVNTYEG